MMLTKRKKEKDLSVVFDTYKKPDALKQTQNKGATMVCFIQDRPSFREEENSILVVRKLSNPDVAQSTQDAFCDVSKYQV